MGSYAIKRMSRKDDGGRDRRQVETDHFICAEGRATTLRRVAAGSAGSGAEGFDGTAAGTGGGRRPDEEGQDGKDAGSAVLHDVLRKDFDADFEGHGGVGTAASGGGFVPR